jgi:transcriptional regulator with XRE-family HTH domain
MGWSQFEQAVDPEARLRAEQESARFDKSYGAAIRKLRQSRSLNQSEIGELTERTVRRIEQGETRATLQAMKKLAMAHKMSVNDYMNEVAKLIPR